MDITKVNSDSDKLNLVNCNIVSVLEEIVMSTVLYASEKKRNIIFDTDSEEIILACDEDKIERIMLNLISNAIKFSQLHTDIEIKIKTNVELNRVYISVKNYGSNIEFNDREKIFERFYRVDNSLNRKNEGCGIGLNPICGSPCSIYVYYDDLKRLGLKKDFVVSDETFQSEMQSFNINHKYITEEEYEGRTNVIPINQKLAMQVIISVYEKKQGWDDVY